MTVPVSDNFARTVDPASVSVHGRRADGVLMSEKPKRNDIVTVRYDLVREIDENGRPVWDHDGGVVSDYHPWSGLRR